MKKLRIPARAKTNHVKRIVIIVAALGFVFLAWVVLMNFRPWRITKSSNPCINSLRVLDGAKQQWSLENHKTNNEAVTWEDIRPYLGPTGAQQKPVCPEGGIYTLGRVNESPKCSIPSHKLP